MTDGNGSDPTTSEVRATVPERSGNEVVAVFVLSIVAVLTAWCGFQSSKWGGEMSIAFSEASGARIQASNAEGTARDARQLDLTIYASWIEAGSEQNAELADYIRERFTPVFAAAFEAWDDGGRVEPSPFARDEYVPDGTDRAAELTARADERFQDALDNNARGDRYSLLTVLFALVLFLTAMSQRNISSWASRSLLGFGILTALVGVAVMLTFPVKI